MKYVTLLITLCVIAVNIIYGINISRSLYKEKKVYEIIFLFYISCFTYCHLNNAVLSFVKLIVRLWMLIFLHPYSFQFIVICPI